MIVTRNLQKIYGKSRALDSISMEIQEGQCAALIGPNGAGKSTLLRILGTVASSNGGSASIAGHDVAAGRAAVRRTIGYLPDEYGVYPEMTPVSFLEFYASAYGIGPAEPRRAVGEMIERLGITRFRDIRAADLSRGHRQCLCLARILLHRPRVLLLDEPCSDLDPTQRQGVIELLRELHAAGTTIVVVSHILPELQPLCDHVVLLEKGRLVLQGNLHDVLSRYDCLPRLRLELGGDRDAAQRLLGGHALTVRATVTDTGVDVVFAGGEPDAAAMVSLLAAENFPVNSVSFHPPDMQTLFFRVTKGDVQ